MVTAKEMGEMTPFERETLAKLESLSVDTAANRKFLDRIELYDITLNINNLISALFEAGLGVPVLGAAEFVVAPGATAQVFQLVPPGFALINCGEAEYFTNLPFMTSYLLYMDNMPPGIPLFGATRMPTNITEPGFIAFIRTFLLHQVTNLDPFNTVNVLVKNVLFLITTETVDMLKRVYFDPVVEDLRDRSKVLSGTPR